MTRSEGQLLESGTVHSMNELKGMALRVKSESESIWISSLVVAPKLASFKVTERIY